MKAGKRMALVCSKAHAGLPARSASLTCSSTALLLSPVTSEISHTNSVRARAKVSRSKGDSDLVPAKLVNDSMITARSNADPELKSFVLSVLRWRQFLATSGSFLVPDIFLRSEERRVGKE